jgi:Uma2 family endonuclease
MVKGSVPVDLYEALVRLPEHLVGEIVGGELVVSPRPAPRNVLASSVLGSDLLGAFGRGKGSGWWILDEPELHLGADVLDPDLAGWQRERLPVLPEEPFFSLPPDWVGEVLSPRTMDLDRARKLPIYAREQVPWAWLVDPLARTLEVLRGRAEGWLLLAVHQGDVTVRVPPFEAVELDLAGWWVPEAT